MDRSDVFFTCFVIVIIGGMIGFTVVAIYPITTSTAHIQVADDGSTHYEIATSDYPPRDIKPIPENRSITITYPGTLFNQPTNARPYTIYTFIFIGGSEVYTPTNEYKVYVKFNWETD